MHIQSISYCLIQLWTWKEHILSHTFFKLISKSKNNKKNVLYNIWIAVKSDYAFDLIFFFEFHGTKYKIIGTVFVRV